MPLFRENWQALYSQIQDFETALTKAQIHLSPINFLETLKDRSSALMIDLRRQNLHIIGNVNFTKLLTVVKNRVDGIQYGLRSGELEKEDYIKVLNNTKEQLMSALAEIATKLDRQNIETLVQSAQNPDRPISEESYNNFTDAMQSVIRKMQTGDAPTDSDKSQSRDLIHMSEVMRRNNDDLQKLREQLNKASLDRFSDENFHLVNGPVLTGAQLDVVKLKAANVDFDTVYFPGIRYGFARKEETPRFYILRNQMLIAVLPRRNKRFQMNLKGTPLNKKMKDDTTRFKEISGDVIQLLQEKTGDRYVQIGAEREKYIVNRQFPNIKFMLIMRRSVFERIGPFGSSNTLELPF